VASIDEIRAEIVQRLRARDAEIKEVIYVRIQDAVPDPVGSRNLEHQAGVHAAVKAVIDYCLEGIAQGPGWSGSIPPAAASQARRAAHARVSLGTVLRRYLAGHVVLGEFVVGEIEHSGLPSHRLVLQHIRRTQEGLLEHLTAAIENEYNHELERLECSYEKRRAEIVQRLLDGEPVPPADVAELDYAIHTRWHCGVIVTGAEAETTVRKLRAGLGRESLSVSYGEGTVWAWLGGRERLPVSDIKQLSAERHASVSLAVGEPGRGIDGWRLTHHQARAAMELALHRPSKFARYADDPLLTAVLQNATLTQSLEQQYLIPLRSQSDGGTALRRTLRAYINAECNATSAASPLNVGRHTVESRIRTAERLLGRPLRVCISVLDVALRLEDLRGDEIPLDGGSLK
jgi:PucR C-terminal helix-turn-helix domain/GGDEF-like domain